MNEVYTVSAKTVDEAREKAAKLYGGRNRELDIEIVELPKKGFLGIGSRDAVIKVSVKRSRTSEIDNIVDQIRNGNNSSEEEEVSPKNTKKNEQPQKNEEKARERDDSRQKKSDDAQKDRGQNNRHNKQNNRHNSNNKKDPSEQKRPAPEADRKQPQKTDDTAKDQAPVRPEGEKKPEKKQPVKPQVLFSNIGEVEEKTDFTDVLNARRESIRESAKEKKQAERDQEPETVVSEPAVVETRVINGISPEELEFAADFVRKIIENLKMDADVVYAPVPDDVEFVKASETDVYPGLIVLGDESGTLIGHHGETLDSVQYLMNLALFRKISRESKEGDESRENIRISLDVGNYREKREDTLRSVARKTAAKAVKYRRNIALDPMNPYDRRIIHTELQNYPDVSTHSVGSDMNRKIVVTYTGPQRSGRNNRRNQNKRRRNNSQSQNTAETATVTETFTEETDSME